MIAPAMKKAGIKHSSTCSRAYSASRRKASLSEAEIRGDERGVK